MARFASQEFSTARGDINNNCVHLTNSSVIKRNTVSYGAGADDGDLFSGYLWTLTRLEQYLATHTNIEWTAVWQSITEVVRLVQTRSLMTERGNSFRHFVDIQS